jgi:CBS domain-containing protein
MNIGKICNRNVLAADVDTSVLEAARMMRHNHVGSIIVTESEGESAKPVGIITDRDLVVEIMAEEIDPQNVTLGDAMTRNPLSACEDDEPYDVLEAMRNKGVRRIPVVDRDGLLTGVLAVDDILRKLSHEMADLVALIQKEYDTEVRLRKII